jgi:hypothetical protein
VVVEVAKARMMGGKEIKIAEACDLIKVAAQDVLP